MRSEKEEEAHSLLEHSIKSSRDSHSTSKSEDRRSAKSRRHKEDEVEGACPVNDRFRVAMDLHSYHLEDGSTNCEEQVPHDVVKWVSSLQVQMKYHPFDPMDPNINYWIFDALKWACDNNRLMKELQYGYFPYL